MIPVQKVMQAYATTMNLNNKGNSFSRKEIGESNPHRSADEKEMKKKFDTILEKAMQKN